MADDNAPPSTDHTTPSEGSATSGSGNASPGVDPSVSFINQTVLSNATLQAESIGKAAQAMSHSLALALQDAADHQRNFSAVNGAALAKATAELAKPDLQWAPIIKALQEAQTTQTTNFNTLSGNIEALLAKLPMPTGGQ